MKERFPFEFGAERVFWVVSGVLLAALAAALLAARSVPEPEVFLPMLTASPPDYSSAAYTTREISPYSRDLVVDALQDRGVQGDDLGAFMKTYDVLRLTPVPTAGP